MVDLARMVSFRALVIGLERRHRDWEVGRHVARWDTCVCVDPRITDVFANGGSDCLTLSISIRQLAYWVWLPVCRSVLVDRGLDR